MDNKPIFENGRDRTDFFIALAVIAFFLWLFLFSGILGNKKNINLSQAGIGLIDSDKDGIADELDPCPNIFADNNTGCPTELDQTDQDGDGVIDSRDECPTIFGKDVNGCPTEATKKDFDGDGIENKFDECPKKAGPASNNGCPIIIDTIDKATTIPIAPVPAPIEEIKVVDKDEDGIADDIDECPELKGPLSTKGCPDADNDGVSDKVDECPNEKGTKENNGCPQIELEEEEQAVIDEAVKNVEFEYGSAQLTNNSKLTLDKVVDLMKKYPESKLRIEGHTDNDSNSDFNLQLSQKRANSAKAYIVSRGVSAQRINAVGLGETQPVATNDTEEGRMKNRRVEFDLK